MLLSDAAVTSAGQSFPDGSSAVDEGFVLLPGSETETEHLWRLAHPVLRSRQRAVQRATSPTAALPVWRTSFVGRSEDVVSIGARLDAGRLVTLVGPAGVGKTRLAAAVAGAASGHAHFVDLTVATKDDEVDGLVADAVGSSRDSAPRKGIEAILRAAPALLVLDNCEHVQLSKAWIDARSRLVDALMLTPLSVVPERQRQGLGTRLLEHALRTADELGVAAVFLEGDRAFYGKRGFVRGASLQLLRPSLRIPEPAFQVARLSRYESWMTGHVIYPESMWETDSVGLRDPRLATIEAALNS